jgi:peptidoglycan/xylan/chitin deacetylase (PgdA/CDA1 family)
MIVSRKAKLVSWLLVLSLLMAVFAAGCVLFASSPDEPGNPPGPGTGEEPGGSDPGGSLPEPKPPDPPEPPAPPQPKPPEPPAPPPPEPPKPQDPPKKDPVIYVGQVLKIPGGGSTAAGDSLVMRKSLVSSGKKEVALTFDSGWLYETTIPLLDVLDRYGVKATFFPRALWVYNPESPAKSYPDLAREIVKRGHTLGNHSLTHPDMTKLTAEEIRHEMRESTRLIQEATGVRPYLFRPPYGVYNKEMLKILGEEGYPYTVMWTVDTHDWADEMRGQKVTTDYIVDRVLKNIADGGIVLMHIAGYKTVEALPRIIEGLVNMGYSFTTVDRMVPPPPGGQATHTVQKGDTLYSLAKRYNTTVEELITLNNL